MRNVATLRLRLRVDEAGAGAAGGEKSPASGLFAPFCGSKAVRHSIPPLARIFHTGLKGLTECKVGRRSCGAGVPSRKRLGRRPQPLEKRFIVPRNLASQEVKRLFHFGWEERKGQQRILGSLPEPPEGGTPNCSRSEFRLQAVPLRAFFRPAIRRFLGSLAPPKYEISGLAASAASATVLDRRYRRTIRHRHEPSQ